VGQIQQFVHLESAVEEATERPALLSLRVCALRGLRLLSAQCARSAGSGGFGFCVWFRLFRFGFVIGFFLFGFVVAFLFFGFVVAFFIFVLSFLFAALILLLLVIFLVLSLVVLLPALVVFLAALVVFLAALVIFLAPGFVVFLSVLLTVPALRSGLILSAALRLLRVFGCHDRTN